MSHHEDQLRCRALSASARIDRPCALPWHSETDGVAPAHLGARQMSGKGSRGMSSPRTVVFVCLHRSAKSVIASAYLNRLSAERGLNVHATAAGVEPDADIPPRVREGLRQEGLDVRGQRPRKVTREELKAAWHVVSIVRPHLRCAIRSCNRTMGRRARHQRRLPGGSGRYRSTKMPPSVAFLSSHPCEDIPRLTN